MHVKSFMNQILALGLACNAGMLGDQRLIAMSRYGDQSPESVELAIHQGKQE